MTRMTIEEIMHTGRLHPPAASREYELLSRPITVNRNKIRSPFTMQQVVQHALPETTLLPRHAQYLHHARFLKSVSYEPLPLNDSKNGNTCTAAELQREGRLRARFSSSRSSSVFD